MSYSKYGILSAMHNYIQLREETESLSKIQRQVGAFESILESTSILATLSLKLWDPYHANINVVKNENSIGSNSKSGFIQIPDPINVIRVWIEFSLILEFGFKDLGLELGFSKYKSPVVSWQTLSIHDHSLMQK